MGWKRLLLFIIPYILIVGVLQLLGAYIVGVDLMNKLSQESIEQSLLISFFGFTGTFLTVFWFMKSIDKEPFLNLGFHFHNHGKVVIAGFFAGFLTMGLSYLILILLKQIRFSNINLLIDELILSSILFLIVSITEETLLRGYVLRNLMISINKHAALVVSAGIFSIMHAWNPHFNWISFTNLYLAGILLGLPYIYTKNLWFPISLHFSWNFFQSLFGFNISGQDSYSLVEFDMFEENIINGGYFGLEGSVLSIFSQLFFIIVLWIFFNNKKNTMPYVS
ncbi:MAG: CPBP family intramembrane metalloprotease [Maribacter sp.]|nr:CPBP family intramembrane metalloprotease [Maribacter sp.]